MRRGALAATLAALVLGVALGAHLAAPGAEPERGLDVVAPDLPAPSAPERASHALPTPGSDPTLGETGESQWRLLPGTTDLVVTLSSGGAGGSFANTTSSTGDVMAPNGTIMLACERPSCQLRVATPVPGVWSARLAGAGVTGEVSWARTGAVDPSLPDYLYHAMLQAGERRSDAFLVEEGASGFTLHVETAVPVLVGSPSAPAARLLDPDGRQVALCTGTCSIPVPAPMAGWWSLSYGSGLPLQGSIRAS